MEQQVIETPTGEYKKNAKVRFGLAILIVVLSIVYTIAIVTGFIVKERRIDVANLGVIAFAIVSALILLYPDFVSRLKTFQVSGVKIELDQVKEKQAEQQSRLDDITLILPLLLPKTEQKHLLKIASGDTNNYQGNHNVRSELRRLRAAGLITSKSKRHISELKDDTTLDISQLVELTMLGKRWVSRIKEIDEMDKPQLKM